MDNILEIIKPYDEIVIAGHTKPDGDAVGSCLALSLIINRIGKKPKVVLEDFTERYNIISGAENIFHGDCSELKPDVFISLDCGSIERLPNNAALLFDKAKITINIDHHISNDSFAKYNYVDADASSTCEVVYRMFNPFISFDKEIATALYAGIIYDTGGLRFKNTSYETMLIAADLMKSGIDHSEIYASIMSRNSYEEIISIGRGIQNLVIDKEFNIGYSFFTLDEMDELKVGKKDLDFIINHIMSIDSVQTGVFIYETDKNVFKVSLRSRIIDVSEFAKFFGGGGHVRAAGCTISGSKNEVYNIIKTKIREEIENVKRCN